jgi:hypothetical protein
MKCYWLAGTWVASLGAAALALDVEPAKYKRPAMFAVTGEVVNEAVEPFTATIGSFGNALVNASFEPCVYRTRFFAEADAPDRVAVGASALTAYDGLREGFYDGAEVRVYRVVDGKVKIVRRDRVAAGGSAMSGWFSALGEGKLVPASGARFAYRFDDWNRPQVPYWFTVAAVAADGAESEKAPAARVLRTSAGKPERKPEEAALEAFKAPKKGAPGAAPQPPRNLRATYDAAAGAAVLEWTASATPGVAGYRVYKTDYDPAQHRGFGLQLAGGAPKSPEAAVRKGDWVVVDKTFMSFSRKAYHSNRVWASHQNKAAMPAEVPVFADEDPAVSWALEPHAAGSPVEGGGEACAKFTLGAGGKLAFEKYNHGPTGQTWYPVLEPGKPYAVEFWARQEGMADPTATFKLNGFYGRTVQPLTFAVGKAWQRFTGTFTVDKRYEGEGGIGQTSLSFSGPGTLWLDGYRVYRQDAPFLDYFPEEYADLKASGMGELRTHAFIKTGTSTYDMRQFTGPAGAINGVEKGNTLPQTLEMMRKAGVSPWLQVEMHMTPEEWLGFVEYLAAPYDPAKDTPAAKPWASKRAAQGRREPWSDAFSRIDFEISNETWNWLFSPWVFEDMADGKTGRKYNRGEVYGLFQEHVIDCLKASPYWAAAGLDKKVRFVLGGWRPQEYGLKAAGTSPRSRLVTRAGYNGGWDEGEGPAEGNDSSLFMAMIHAGQSAIPEAAELRQKRDALRQAGAADFQIGTYEAGPGYALSGLNNQARMTEAQVRAQEETMKSLGGGTATLDSFLGRAACDYDIQNFFTYYHGRTHWVSHTALRGGPRAHPCWLTLALFNTQAAGDMLRVDATSAPAVDIPAFKRRKAAPDVPLAACYATRRGDRLCVFVLSRKIDNYPLAGDDGFTPVTIRLPIARARAVKLFRMAGNPRSHNIDAAQVKVEALDLPAAVAGPSFAVNERSGADARGLPPGATLLYVFEGVSEK